MPDVSLSQIPFDFGQRENYDLTSFLPGENQSLLTLINLISRNELNHAVYLWGNKASGKTHLLQAACKQASESGQQAAYIPLQQCDEISVEILHDLGEIDLVCIDDIDSITGKTDWQQGLVWLYNELRDKQHSIIFSGLMSSNNIRLEVEDLKSRLASDQVFQIKEPDDELKVRILKQRAEGRSFELNDDVLEYLIRRADRDLSSLIILLDDIDHASLAAKRKITIPFIKEFIN